MTCYDCALDGRATSLVAICARCGVGACSQHVRVRSEPVGRAAGVGTRTLGPRARRATCTACSAAEAHAG